MLIRNPQSIAFGLLLALFTALACGNKKAAPTVTIRIVGLGLEAGERLRRNALDEFTRTTGIRADLIPTWGTSAEQLASTQRLLSQHAITPDLYVIDVIWPGTVAAGLMDLTPHINSEAHSHVPELLKNDTVEGRLVCLPFYVNVGLLYYRTDLLKKYGYAHPPATWDELETMAAQIQKGERAAGSTDFWGYVWQGARYEGLTCNALEWQASFGGGRIMEQDHTITVNNPRVIQAFRKAAGWVGNISPASVLAYTESDSLNAFRSGKAAFMRHWSAGLSARLAWNSPVHGRFATTVLPAGPRGRAQTMGGFQIGVSKYSAHPRESVKLVRYLTSTQVQLRRALDGGYLPTIPSLYARGELLRIMPELSLLTNDSDAWVTRPSTVAGNKYYNVSRAYYETVHAILSNKIGAADGLAALEKQLSQLTGFRSGSPGS